MRDRRVVVVGDVMLDEFVWGRVGRISPEAPVPVVEVTRESFHLGGACNVASNVRELEGRAVVVGVVGTDRESADDAGAPLQDAMLARIRSALPGCGALVLSDYQKGVLTPRLMKALLTLARRAGVPVLVGPKGRHFALFRRGAAITPNQLEAEQATGLRIRNPEELERAGRRIINALGCEAALITRGEQGMSLFPREARTVHIPTTAREVYDVTGAGDTVIATLGLALAAGASLTQGAVLANYAAGVVVGKLGTATATPREVLAAVERGAGE